MWKEYERGEVRMNKQLFIAETVTMASLESEACQWVEKALLVANNPVIAYSGGKDSDTTAQIVHLIDDTVPMVFCNTNVEYEATVTHCRSQPNLIELSPYQKSFWQCVDEYGWPTIKSKGSRHGNWCCYFLKEKPAEIYYQQEKVDLVFTGLTMEESRNRMMFFKRMGPLYKMKTGLKQWKCHPIYNWTIQEVWEYIHFHEIEYNPIYDKGAVRCGCMPCTAYISWKMRLARENPKLLTIILRKQRQAQLPIRFEDELCKGGGA